MNALSELIGLPQAEKITRGLAHTPAEIAQQPDTWVLTFEIFRKNRERLVDFIGVAGISANPKSSSEVIVFLVGAGTSDYIGQSLAFLLRKCWRCEVIAVPSTDLLTHADDLMMPGKKYLWISFSRSGDSPEGVAALEYALKAHPDIHHLIISCHADGRMMRENANRPNVLGICLDDSVNDRGLAMTSSFTNMVVFGQFLAHLDNLDYCEHLLAQLVVAGSTVLPVAAECASRIATAKFTKACFVGSGPLRGTSKESALKLLELTAGKIVTLSESALGLRHGPMAALDKDTLFVCFLSTDHRVQKYELDLLHEVAKKKLVQIAVAVGGRPGVVADSMAQEHLTTAELGNLPDQYRPAVDVIFGQLLGLFFSLRFNLQPDRPSPSGAISRVVQEFSIHL